jgi:Domain of unknown function (DUF4157)
MRDYTFERKKAARSTFSNPSLVSPDTPTLANPVRGFGLPTNNVIQTQTAESTDQQQAQAADEKSLLLQALEQPSFGHDISRIALRRPQAKLTVGAPNDVYEQEADRVAEQVMSMTDAKPSMQRETMPEEEEEIQTKTLGNSIQREAMPEEEEEIQTKPLAPTITPLVQREAVPQEEEELQTKALGDSIQREAMSEEEEEIQTKRSPDAGFQAGNNLESRLSSSQGGGSPLPEEVRSFMEPRFGADFSQVRVHTGSEAVQMNRDLNAQAFTHKQDVYFGAGKAPGKDALTAHELTHVVQQTTAVQTKPAVYTTTIQREPTNPTVTSAQQQQTASGPRALSKQDFLNRCGQVNTIIDAADRGATAWLLSVALAYGDAWKNHTDTLKGQAENERLQQELILGAALAFIPGGVGGEIGAALKRCGSSDFIIDGVKDLAKYGGRSPAMAGLKATGVGGQASPGLAAFPTDPLQWQNQVALRIKSELLIATKTLEKWQESANTNDPNFTMDFDPVVAMNGAVVVEGKKAAELKPVDQAETSKTFEKGFWKEWLEQYGFKLVGNASRVGVFYGAESNYGKKIKNRCKSFGLDVEQYASVARERVEAEAQRRNQQAREGK